MGPVEKRDAVCDASDGAVVLQGACSRCKNRRFCKINHRHFPENSSHNVFTRNKTVSLVRPSPLYRECLYRNIVNVRMIMNDIILLYLYDMDSMNELTMAGPLHRACGGKLPGMQVCRPAGMLAEGHIWGTFFILLEFCLLSGRFSTPDKSKGRLCPIAA